jgi:hypothetical protein
MRYCATATWAAITRVYVDDFDAALSHLKAHKVRIRASHPQWPAPAPARPVYFSPWGRQRELLSFERQGL